MTNRIRLAVSFAVLTISGVAGADDSATIKLFGEKCAMCQAPTAKPTRVWASSSP